MGIPASLFVNLVKEENIFFKIEFSKVPLIVNTVELSLVPGFQKPLSPVIPS